MITYSYLRETVTLTFSLTATHSHTCANRIWNKQTGCIHTCCLTYCELHSSMQVVIKLYQSFPHMRQSSMKLVVYVLGLVHAVSQWDIASSIQVCKLQSSYINHSHLAPIKYEAGCVRTRVGTHMPSHNGILRAPLKYASCSQAISIIPTLAPLKYETNKLPFNEASIKPHVTWW